MQGVAAPGLLCRAFGTEDLASMIVAQHIIQSKTALRHLAHFYARHHLPAKLNGNMLHPREAPLPVPGH